jgi:hypothetical protein
MAARRLHLRTREGPALARDTRPALFVLFVGPCRLVARRCQARDRSWSTVIKITIAHVGPALAADAAASSSIPVRYVAWYNVTLGV